MNAHAEMPVGGRQFSVLRPGGLQIGRALAQELARKGTGCHVAQVVRRRQQDIRERVGLLSKPRANAAVTRQPP
jgi:NAD(P)-dependent dehydrogenase (short-subunit alcohol dehydrogenase family)